MDSPDRQANTGRTRRYYEALAWVMPLCGAANKANCYMLYVALADYAYLPGGPFVGIDALSTKTGMSRRVIDRAIKDAKDLGLIRSHPGRGRQGTSYWELAQSEPFMEVQRSVDFQLSAWMVLGGKPCNVTEVRLDSLPNGSRGQLPNGSHGRLPNGSTSSLSDLPEIELPENLRSGCTSDEANTMENGTVIERLGEPPSLQGRDKDAQKKTINDYVATPPSLLSSKERKDWHRREAQWHYPHDANTRTKALYALAWVLGIHPDDVMWDYPNAGWYVDQVQKAISGLTEDGYDWWWGPQSSTALKWVLARAYADGMFDDDGVLAWPEYVSDPEYRYAAWPEVAKPGAA